MSCSDLPLVVLLEPSRAFGGFLETLVREAGFRVHRLTSIEELLLFAPRSGADLVVSCATLLDLSDHPEIQRHVHLVIRSGDPTVKETLSVPKLFSPRQLRDAAMQLGVQATER